MACESLVLLLLVVALLQPVSAYYPLPYTQGESPGNGESRSCGCRTRLNYLDLYVYMYNEDKLYVGDFGSSVCEKAIIVAL